MMRAPSFLRPLTHELIAFAVLGLILLPLSVALCDLQKDRLTYAKGLQEQKARQLSQLSHDLESTKTLRAKLSESEIKALVQPMNAEATIPLVKPLAQSYGLREVTVTHAPSKSWPGNDDFVGIQGIAQSDLHLMASAPYEQPVFDFLGALGDFGGKIMMKSYSLRRVEGPDKRIGLEITADMTWLMNEAKP